MLCLAKMVTSLVKARARSLTIFAKFPKKYLEKGDSKVCELLHGGAVKWPPMHGFMSNFAWKELLWVYLYFDFW